MKSSFIYILLFLSNFIFGQNNLPDKNEDIIINENLTAKPGEFYVDGIKVEPGKMIIHEQNIKEIKVYKGENSKIFSGAIGATIIVRKKEYEFITLSKFVADLKNGNEKLKNEKYIEVILNGILIDQTENYQIELNPKMKITIQNYSDDGIYHGGQENKPNTQIIIETKK
uniref:hypothetical protein n=1 Tax=Flavobacterium sp. TaxID=239 RepID=UPI00404B0D6D